MWHHGAEITAFYRNSWTGHTSKGVQIWLPEAEAQRPGNVQNQDSDRNLHIGNEIISLRVFHTPGTTVCKGRSNFL